MLRNRLLAATAAFALASAQVTPGWALLPSPDVTTLPAGTSTTKAASTGFVGTAIANLQTYLLALLQQNYTLQVPSAAALSQIVGFTGVVVKRGDVDAAYAYTSTACYTGIFAVQTGTSTAVPGDMGASIPAPNNGCWQLVANDKPLSVKIWNLVDDATGATGVGTNNNAIVIGGNTYDAANSAVSYASATGRTLYWPGNKYRLTKPIGAALGLTTFGDGCYPPNQSGTTLYFDHSGKGLTFNGAGETKLRDFCTLRNQPTPSSTAGTAWTPNANDYDINSVAQDLEIDNVYTTNPTKQLYITQARLISRGLRGEPFQIGVFIDDSQDTDVVDQYRQWPYWSGQYSANAQANVAAYQKANLDLIHLGRADNPFLSHIFGINANHCVTFSNSTITPADGGANKVHLTDLDCDIGGGAAIWFNNTTSSSLIAENITGQQGRAILEFSTNASQNTVQLTQTRATLMQSSAIIMPPELYNNVYASGLMIDGFAEDGSTSPAISVGTNNVFLNQDLNPIIYQRSPGTSQTWLGGTKYVVPYQAARPIWGGTFDGSGEYTISAGLNGPIAEVLVSGGSVSIIGQTYSTFTVVSPTNGSNTNDAGALANTPAGKIGLYYLSGTGYRFVNNTGAAGSTANITWREKRMGPQQ